MLDVSESIDLPVSVAKAWALIGDFSSMEGWHPYIAKTVRVPGPATERELHLQGDGGSVRERRLDDAGKLHFMRYAMVDTGPVPIDEYVSELAASARPGGGSRVTWSATFRAKGASDQTALDTIKGFFRAGLDALPAHFPSSV